MIEWIKITPETEFPKSFIVANKDSWSTYYWCNINECFIEDSRLDTNRYHTDFTHYAIINLPKE